MKRNDLGRKIAKLRKAKGLTQVELGDMLNVTDKTISKWEKNRSKPDYDTLENMSKIFEVRIEFFLKDIRPIAKLKDLWRKLKHFLKQNWHNVIFTILFVLLAIYFFNTHDSLAMYEIVDTDLFDKINFDNSYFIKSKSNVVITINNIEYQNDDKDIINQKIKLYTITNNDKVYLYEAEDLDDILYNGFFNYNLTRRQANHIPNSLYLEIENLHEDNRITSDTIKLSFSKLISSDKVFYIEKNSVENKSTAKTNVKIDEFTLVEHGYTKVEDSKNFYRETKDFILYFALDSQKMFYNKKIDKDIIESFEYYYIEDKIEYKRQLKNKMNNHYCYYKADDKVKCFEGNCDNYLVKYQEVLKVFNKEIERFAKS